jgi:hypothetical protein
MQFLACANAGSAKAGKAVAANKVNAKMDFFMSSPEVVVKRCQGFSH